MNCQDALDLLYDIIDREASEVDAQQVKEHLENCRDCFEVYRLEQSMQDFINESIQNPAPTPKSEDLRTKILSRLDDIDRENPSRREPRFFSLTTRTLVAAASLVILIGAALLLAAFYRHSDLYIPLERAHWTATDNIEPYRNSQSTATLISDIHENYSYEVAPEVMDYSLLGASTENIMGVDMNHLVYQKGEKVVSAFVVPADRFELSSDLDEARVKRNDIVFFDHNCRGCRLVFHRIGSLIIITATTDRDTELLDFVPGISAI